MPLKLQKPNLINVGGTTLVVRHPLLDRNVRQRMAGNLAAGATSLILYDNNGIADDDYLLLGIPKNQTTEVVRVNDGSISRGQTIGIENTTDFDHEREELVTVLRERQIKIYGATDANGSGEALVATIDIQWDQPATIYTDTTGYAFYAAEFTDGSVDSDKTAYISASNFPRNYAVSLIDEALDVIGDELDGGLTYDKMIGYLNDYIDEVSQYVNPTTQEDIMWNHEEYENTLTGAVMVNRYELSELSKPIKDDTSLKGIIGVQIGTRQPLKPQTDEEMSKKLVGSASTQLNDAGGASIGDTSITVDSTADFATNGVLHVGDQTITYTGKTATTFTGIPAAGDGSITSAIADDAYIWQGANPGLPEFYTVFNGQLIFERPFSDEYDGQNIKIKYFREMDSIVDLTDVVEIPFKNIAKQYLVYRIHKYRNDARQEKALGQFLALMDKKAISNDSNPSDISQYWHLSEGDLLVGPDTR